MYWPLPGNLMQTNLPSYMERVHVSMCPFILLDHRAKWTV